MCDVGGRLLVPGGTQNWHQIESFHFMSSCAC